VNTIKVYYIDLRHFTQQDDFYLESKLSKKRWENIQHYRCYEDKKRSIYSEMLVKYAVYNSKSPIEKIQFEENNYGKPRVKGWNLNYNVSHSGNYVVLAINNKDIGIDIQEKFEIDFGVLQFFHKFEQKAIQKDPSLFFTFWSLKESYLKYLGVGLSRSLDSFVIMNYPDFKCNEDHLITFESIDIDNDNYSSYICYRNNEKSQIDLLEVSERDLISTIGKYSG